MNIILDIMDILPHEQLVIIRSLFLTQVPKIDKTTVINLNNYIMFITW